MFNFNIKMTLNSKKVKLDQNVHNILNSITVVGLLNITS